MTQEEVLCLDEFVRQVQQEVTVACQIPFSIPKEEIIRITDRATKWFYKHYEYSVQEKYYMIKASAFSTSQFKKTGEVIMPKSTFAVNAVYQIGEFSGEDGGFGNNSFAGLDPDFALDKFIYNNVYGAGIGSEQLMYYTLNAMFIDMARMQLQNMMSYNYNNLNYKFRFMGQLPTNTCVFLVYEKIDNCSLYTDEIFIRYVVAQVKLQLSRVTGTFEFNLPGNVKINYSDIKSEAQDEIKAIEEEIKGDEGVDYFLTD
jgi:hypothetical protein